MEIRPVTSGTWPDLARLFEAHGNPNYCWCMTWRISGSEFRECESGDRKEALRQKVDDGVPVGVLGYIEGEPAGWCSVAPRETYGRLERSRSIGRADDKNTWSVVCFFIDPEHRREGTTLGLLKGAIDYARSGGAVAVEGYPVEPKTGPDGEPDYEVSYRFMGYLSTFKKAGFRDVTPEGSARRIMRYDLK